jgi:hypothetical protein
MIDSDHESAGCRVFPLSHHYGQFVFRGMKLAFTRGQEADSSVDCRKITVLAGLIAQGIGASIAQMARLGSNRKVAVERGKNRTA